MRFDSASNFACVPQQFLYPQATDVPELQLRVSWDKGTLVMWDNERTQHYIVRDTQYDRVMHRVMVNTGR